VKAFWRGAFVLATASATLLGAKGASAHAARVVLVSPKSPDPTITEALNRIRGELAAEGFDVVVVDAFQEADLESTFGNTDADSGSLAAIGLSVDEGTHIAELRVVDHATNKTVLRRTPVIDAKTPHAAEVLSIRAVELLRASLLELVLERPAASEQTPRASPEVRQAADWAARKLPAEREPQWGFEAGVGVLADFGGVPPALVGVLRVRRILVGPLSLRVTAAGLGTTAHVDAQAGTASMTQGLGLVEAVLALWPKSMVHPVVSLGAGALYAGVQGQADWPYLGRSSSEWALAFDAGMGADIRMGRHFAISCEAHLFVARPYPVVEILGSDAARSGEPSVLGSLSVVGWL
jgi:hypothetical protein